MTSKPRHLLRQTLEEDSVVTVGFLTSAAITRFSTVIYAIPVSQHDSGLFFNAGVREAAFSAQKRRLDQEKHLCASCESWHLWIRELATQPLMNIADSQWEDPLITCTGSSISILVPPPGSLVVTKAVLNYYLRRKILHLYGHNHNQQLRRCWSW